MNTWIHTHRKLLVGFIGVMVLVNIWLFPSAGTVDARNWEAIFRDILSSRYHFIPDCLNYLCPSNLVLEKFPPGHFLLFFLFSFLFPPKILGTLIATKAVILFFYGVTLAALIWFAHALVPKKWSTFSIIVLFASLISLILNTQGLAYTDVLGFPFFIMSIASLMKKRYGVAGFFYAMCCLVKWQPIMLLPVCIVYIYKEKAHRIINLLRYVCGIAGAIVFFYILNPNIFHAITLSLQSAMGHHGTYALNVTWIIQSMYPSLRYIFHSGDIYPPVPVWQKILYIIPYGLVVMSYLIYPHKPAKRGQELLMALLIGLVTYYLFSFGVHENHFILATVVAFMLYIVEPTKIHRNILLIVDGVNFINMFLFYGLTGAPLISRIVWGYDISIVVAFIFSLTFFIWYFRWLSTLLIDRKK